MKEMSIVFPTYNSEMTITKTLEAAREYLHKNQGDECIFVNDGSEDNTVQKIASFITEHAVKNIRLVTYTQNKGKGNAVRQGILRARKAYVCFLDDDLAYDLDHVAALKKALETADIVIGSRGLYPPNHHAISPLRKFIGRVFNAIIHIILSIPYTDTQAGMKGFRTEKAKILFTTQYIKKFAFDVEILYKAQRDKYSIAEIPARVSLTHRGQETKVNIIKDSITMFLSLLKIRIKYG